MKGRDRYPRAAALLDQLAAGRPQAPLPTGPFAVGPAVLRAPPEVARRTGGAPRKLDEPDGDPHTEEMLGELVDMVFVTADEAEHGDAEIHMVFKAEVLGGLHLRLVKKPDGMHATFVVEDAAARRAVVSHLDGLVAHLKGRGVSIASHRIELSSAATAAPSSSGGT